MSWCKFCVVVMTLPTALLFRPDEEVPTSFGSPKFQRISKPSWLIEESAGF
uniref:Uncharacterized protein n=1 Tax=Anguilla anguilla TaxID=7936 RepID=A0A0E9XEG8_ANGAN